MRTLITGGAGFIGSYLAEAYLSRGDEVYVIDDLSTGSLENINPLLKNPRFRFTNDTILNRDVMLELTGIWQSTGSANKSSFTATLAGQSILFDWFAACTLPVEQTDKALAIAHNQRVSVSGTISTVTYSIGTFGPELHIKLTNASITDTAPPAPTMGPISIRSAAAKVRLTDAQLLDPDKDKDQQMAAAAAKADNDAADYIDEHHLTFAGQADLAVRHGQPYTGMPVELLMLMGKALQIQSDIKSAGVETKTILFSTYGYADDAWLITIRGDSVAQVKKVPIPDAKFYATAQDAPPAPPPAPPPPPPAEPKKPTLPAPPPENVPF